MFVHSDDTENNGKNQTKSVLPDDMGTSGMKPKKDAMMPIRLSEDEKGALQHIADETGLSSSTIVRLLISALISSYRRNGGKLVLPVSMSDLAEK